MLVRASVKQGVNGGVRSKMLRYKVNFTSDLSDTLAEVDHLERLGFTVPDVARNMTIQVNAHAVHKFLAMQAAIDTYIYIYTRIINELNS